MKNIHFKSFVRQLKLAKGLRVFQGKLQMRCHRNYHVINELLYKWCGKCTSAKVYSEGSLLQGQAMGIAKQMEEEELTHFTASIALLEKWKLIHRVREKKYYVEKLMMFPRQ